MKLAQKIREVPINCLVQNTSFPKKESKMLILSWKGFLLSSTHMKELKESS